MSDENKPADDLYSEDDESVEAVEPVENIAGSRPWHRRSDESVRAFEAFNLYLNSEPRRLSDVAAKLVPACSTPNVARWSSRYNWQGRVWEWDAEQEELRRGQEAKDRISMRKRHIALGCLLQSIAAAGLKEWQAKLASGAPLNLSADEVVSLMKVGSELERRALGEEKDHGRFTKIIVTVSGYENEEEYEDTLRGKGNTVN
jgi:hypothetical protein